MQVNRYELLREWMRDHNVTFTWAARQLGLNETGVRKMLKADRMPPNRHQQFIDLRTETGTAAAGGHNHAQILKNHKSRSFFLI